MPQGATDAFDVHLVGVGVGQRLQRRQSRCDDGEIDGVAQVLRHGTDRRAGVQKDFLPRLDVLRGLGGDESLGLVPFERALLHRRFVAAADGNGSAIGAGQQTLLGEVIEIA